ncbi:MAG: T9SS type A sorting domain-containing protein [Bacteroidetes bacterium]|nr:T9SS type A sorting domain-containing protein [Bacteroidota bacterium]
MKKLSIIAFLIIICTTQSNSQEDEYWQLVTGAYAKNLIQLDSATMVFIMHDWSLVEEENAYRPNTLKMHYFNITGEYKDSATLNFREIFPEYSIDPLMEASHHGVGRLRNGNFLVGGHGNLVTHSGKTQIELSHKFFQFQFVEDSKSQAYNESPPLVHPMIFTLTPNLDEVIRLDTLQAVPFYGSITLIHEVAPDTLIIGFHKSNESRHEILETDSLFNVRWSTEFGQIGAWTADIYDFEVTEDGHYLVNLRYYYPWSRHVYYRNRLFKFNRNDGSLMWQKIIRKSSNSSSFNYTITDMGDDKYLLAYDDCCEYPTDMDYTGLIFHENTGLHLRVIDSDGNTLQEKSLIDFLSAHIYTWDGNQYGGIHEDPAQAKPWYKPFQTIKNPDNTYLISGIHYSSPGYTKGRGFLLKLSAELEPIWVRVFEIDKKNYPYNCATVAWINNILNNEENIFISGRFESVCGSYNPSPYYPPFYYGWFYWAGLFVTLDKYGCYEEGCHLHDNIAEWEYDSRITFYPNPTSDILNIKIDRPTIENNMKTLFISDLSGRGMLTKHFTGNELQVSIKGFNPGIYLAYIFSDGHILKAEKIVVR